MYHMVVYLTVLSRFFSSYSLRGDFLQTRSTGKFLIIGVKT